ncbi:hypothetical protein TgHK011_007622 [Trichoderma gracile]|nr:hypothetical protein TgHK011_007622 [Trichoderma gracile]
MRSETWLRQFWWQNAANSPSFRGIADGGKLCAHDGTVCIKHPFEDDDFPQRPSIVTPSDYPSPRDLWMPLCYSGPAPTIPRCLD